jgi:hypothetical protein
MTVTAKISFPPATLAGPAFAALVREVDVGFRPARIETSDWNARYGPKALKRLDAAASLTYAELSSSEYEFYIGYGSVGGLEQQQINWDAEDPGVLRAGIDAITRRHPFTVAYLSDLDDAVWQSEETIGNYENARRPHDHLRKVPGRHPAEPLIVDVSEHWGRMRATYGFWLWAASTMWFGPPAFERLDRERLLSLPVGELSERDDGVLVLELFPLELFETDLDEARERQRVFWSWMDLAALEP